MRNKNTFNQHPRPGGFLAAAGFALAAGLALVFTLRHIPEPVGARPAPASRHAAHAIPNEPAAKDAADAVPVPDDEAPDADEPAPTLTATERAEAEADANVDAFDALTDKYRESAKDGVTMADVDIFVAAFRKVPKDRQDECIHRALNLVPDDNALLLVGVLMDKSADREIVETVFNDILNRSEDVKKPILRQIFADKTHPCWANTAWILGVTGEKL